MIVKVRGTYLFPNTELTDDFVRSVLGKPVMDGNKQIGVIVGYNNDFFSFDIDDDYKEKIILTHEIRSCEMEVRDEH